MGKLIRYFLVAAMAVQVGFAQKSHAGNNNGAIIGLIAGAIIGASIVYLSQQQAYANMYGNDVRVGQEFGWENNGMRGRYHMESMGHYHGRRDIPCRTIRTIPYGHNNQPMYDYRPNQYRYDEPPVRTMCFYPNRGQWVEVYRPELYIAINHSPRRFNQMPPSHIWMQQRPNYQPMRPPMGGHPPAAIPVGRPGGYMAPVGGHTPRGPAPAVAPAVPQGQGYQQRPQPRGNAPGVLPATLQ